jgi:hypothetical protein
MFVVLTVKVLRVMLDGGPRSKILGTNFKQIWNKLNPWIGPFFTLIEDFLKGTMNVSKRIGSNK